jgi:hypothetical protein
MCCSTIRAGVVNSWPSRRRNPRSWIPPDVVTYSTLNWDYQRTFDKAAGLYNSLTSENEFQMEVQRRISERLGVDFEKEVLAAMEGRVTFAQWVEKPVRINSITSLVGVKLKDVKAFEPTMQKVFDKYADRIEKKSYAGTTYWTISCPKGRSKAHSSAAGPLELDFGPLAIRPSMTTRDREDRPCDSPTLASPSSATIWSVPTASRPSRQRSIRTTIRRAAWRPNSTTS